MSVYDQALALALGSAAAGLLLTTSPGSTAGTPHAAVRLQTGPLALDLGGPGWARLASSSDCLSRGCPLLRVSLERSAAPEAAPEQSRGVKTCQTGPLDRGWFIAERADEGFGEERRVCEAARPETA